MTDETGKRLKDVEDNIKLDLDVLKDYEDALRYEMDPRRIMKYNREIQRQRESLARYSKEYEELKRQAAPAQIQKVADLLQQQETKLGMIQELVNKKLLPKIWNVPHLRNNNFTGRKDILSGLRGALTSGENTVWK